MVDWLLVNFHGVVLVGTLCGIVAVIYGLSSPPKNIPILQKFLVQIFSFALMSGISLAAGAVFVGLAGVFILVTHPLSGLDLFSQIKLHGVGGTELLSDGLVLLFFFPLLTWLFGMIFGVLVGVVCVLTRKAASFFFPLTWKIVLLCVVCSLGLLFVCLFTFSSPVNILCTFTGGFLLGAVSIRVKTSTKARYIWMACCTVFGLGMLLLLELLFARPINDWYSPHLQIVAVTVTFFFLGVMLGTTINLPQSEQRRHDQSLWKQFGLWLLIGLLYAVALTIVFDALHFLSFLAPTFIGSIIGIIGSRGDKLIKQVSYRYTLKTVNTNNVLIPKVAFLKFPISFFLGVGYIVYLEVVSIACSFNVFNLAAGPYNYNPAATLIDESFMVLSLGFALSAIIGSIHVFGPFIFYRVEALSETKLKIFTAILVSLSIVLHTFKP